jgi:monoamine oxidase
MPKTGLTRRQVLAGLSAAPFVVSGMAAAGSGTTSHKKSRSNHDYDVIVVGGGFSGIAAARDCQRAGLRTAVLEARNRLGGRTFSSRLGKDHVELGGTWVHWSQPFVWSELTRYGLHVEESPQPGPGGDVVLMMDGKPVRLPYNTIGAEWEDALQKFFVEARTIWPRPFDGAFAWEEIKKRDTLTVVDRFKELKLTPRQILLFTAWIETCSHGPVAEASYTEMLRWWALGGYTTEGQFNSTGRYMIVEGTSGLIDCMVKEANADIHLRTPVKQIEQDNSGVIIHTTSGKRLSAQAAILALPMNVLDKIDCKPALAPLKLEAARKRHTGVGLKALMRVKGDLGNIQLLAPGGYGIGYCWPYRPSDGSTTVLVAFGDDAKAMNVNSKESTQAALRQFLPNIEVEECMGYSWTTDPYSLGTWCCYRPGGITRYWNALKQDEGRLYMAGADISDGWRGFIDGAIGSGIDAAQRVIKRLL